MMKRTQYALVTGCGKGGIGEALTKQLIAHDFDVVATVLPHEPAGHLSDPRCHVQLADVTDEGSVRALVKYTDSLTGGYLDVLANNAGICYQYPAVDYDMKTVERLFAVNTLGPIRMVQAFHRLLVNAQGVVFNTGSTAAMFPSVYQAAYCASKAALHQYANVLRLEMEPLGVRVITVVSGEVDTGILTHDVGRTIPEDSVYAPMEERYQEYLHRSEARMAPDEYARGVVAHVLKKNASSHYWRGSRSLVVKILHQLFPRSTYDIIARRMFHTGEFAVIKLPLAAPATDISSEIVSDTSDKI